MTTGRQDMDAALIDITVNWDKAMFAIAWTIIGVDFALLGMMFGGMWSDRRAYVKALEAR